MPSSHDNATGRPLSRGLGTVPLSAVERREADMRMDFLRSRDPDEAEYLLELVTDAWRSRVEGIKESLR